MTFVLTACSDDGYIISPESVYQVFDQDQRRVQYGVSERQAWPDCQWYRFRLDVSSQTPRKFFLQADLLRWAATLLQSSTVAYT